MTCQDDANFVGPVSLFCGVETAKWNDQQFIDAAQFAKSHGVSSLLIKVSEVGSGAGDIWYGGMSGIDHIKSIIEAQGVKFIPYTFPVGPYIDLVQNIQAAVNIAVQLIQRYGVVCLDVEGSAWVGSAGVTAGQALGNALKNIPGKLWLSCPANPVSAGQQGAFQALSPAVNVWMPMTYNDNLTGVYKDQMNKINAGACIQPTLDLSQEFGANDVLSNAKKIKADGCLSVSLWYHGFATQDTSLVDQIVSLFGGHPSVQPMPPQGGVNLKLDSNGCVVITPKSFQLETGESPDLCGPWSVVALADSVPPSTQLSANINQETVDTFTDDMVDYIWQGTTVNHINFPGVNDSDMIKILNYVRDHTGLIHYWVIPGNLIPQYVNAGYPCLFSCNEADITAWNKSKQQWEHAYPWSLSAGHVLPVTGIEKGTGNWICPDQLNNSYQGYWPVIYKASDIQKSLSWACAIQLVGPDKSKPWLAPIPDPSKALPTGFNAQLFAGGTVPPSPTPPTPTTDYKRKAFETEVTSILSGISTTSGIMSTVYTAYQQGKYYGPALTKEYNSTDWSGNAIAVQNFAGCRVEWNNGNGRIFPYG